MPNVICGLCDSRGGDARGACVHAEAARTDRIGKGFVPQIQPLTGVLAKILQRKEEAIKRCIPGHSCPPFDKCPSSNPMYYVRQLAD